MKNPAFFIILIAVSALFWSCQKKGQPSANKQHEPEEESQFSAEFYEWLGGNNNSDLPDISIEDMGNYDWLVDYDWSIADGRDYVDPKEDHIYWHSFQRPYAFIKKLEIPSESVLYQARLRTELFYFLYQTEEKNKLFPIGSAFGTKTYDIEFHDDNKYLSRSREGVYYGRHERVGQQINTEYPLVGIWGSLPALTEYRLVDPADCIYFFEIDEEIPLWAVHRGTYLLKQTGDRMFETISSFPDGMLRLEIKNKDLLLLTPLFTSSENEDEIAGPLILRRVPKGYKNSLEEDY